MGWEETQGEGGGVGRALPMTAHEESKQYTGESKQYTDMLHEGIGKTLSKDVSCDSPKEREGLDLTHPPFPPPSPSQMCPLLVNQKTFVS